MSHARARSASYGLAFSSVVLGTTAQLLLKTGLGQRAGNDPVQVLLAAGRNPRVIAGVLVFGLSSLLWLVVLSRLQLSVAYPIGALTYVLVVGASAALGEHVSALRWLGVMLVAAGVLLVGMHDIGRVESEVDRDE